jgi:hypothetical protein
MKLFSQRKGLKPIKTLVQLDAMDGELRNALWNTLCSCYWKKVRLDYYKRLLERTDAPMYRLCQQIWADFFKALTDTVPVHWEDIYREIRAYFLKCTWNEVYDFIEFVSNVYGDEDVNAHFQKICNGILERELSAYRFVGGKISRITSEEEIAAVEEAIQSPDAFKPVSAHIARALGLLADRKAPDYRNSIKESISAVEATCKLLTGEPKADLHYALKHLANRVGLHPALKEGFIKMYAFTSDEHGIRHALLDESDLSFEDAKFMLVSCSAFVNYLKAKSLKGSAKPRVDAAM